LLLGILLVVVGGQFISIGLLGEMMAAAFHPESNYLIKKRLVKDQSIVHGRKTVDRGLSTVDN